MAKLEEKMIVNVRATSLGLNPDTFNNHEKYANNSFIYCVGTAFFFMHLE